MTQYDFRYVLAKEPEARTDGSGQVAHDVEAVFREEGSGDAWVSLPAHHKQNLVIPAAVLQAALASGTNQEKIAAYKAAFVEHLNSQADPMPALSWDEVELQAFADANDAASEAQSVAHTFITVTLELVYPVPFSV